MVISLAWNVFFYLYLGECATQTSESDVLSHIRYQCIIEAKCEPLQCSSNDFKAFEITLKASKKEKHFSASICIEVYSLKHILSFVLSNHMVDAISFLHNSVMICFIAYKSINGYKLTDKFI